MEYYFDTDDKLERKKYAEFLKSMLENCDKYRREDSDGAYVIAIDSPWGTGKTRFAKMLRNYLEDRTKEMGDDSLPGKRATFNAIYYNSWETDFSDDALQPLIHTIVNSPEFETERFETENHQILETFKNSAIAVAKVAGYALLHHFLGETATQMAQAVDETTSQTKYNPLEDYQNRLETLQEFRESLRNIIAQTKQGKLVVIIDELDRCRPSFAIQTLEIAKHLFSVKGLVFVFALDIKQLSSSVKTIYGLELDAPGYFCRFFDYIGRIPAPDFQKFIKSQLSRIDFYITSPSHFTIYNVEYVKRLAMIFGFSLRDIDTFIKSYFAITNYFLSHYDDYRKHQVYLFLLALKYKDIDVYNNVFKIPPISTNGREDSIGKFALDRQEDYSSILRTFDNVDILRNAFFEINCQGKTKKHFSARIISVDISDWRSNRQLRIKYKAEPGGVFGELSSTDFEEFSWGNVLFYEDIAKWEEIKDFTVSEYMYSQLEMFNFALTADNTESKA